MKFEDIRRLTFESLQIALCPLIPIPLLDDWAQNLLRRRLTARLIEKEDAALRLENHELKLLALGLPEEGRGCLGGCLFFGVLKPIYFIVKKVFFKVFRKILFFLTIKDCVDRFSYTFHEAWLVRHAAQQGLMHEHDVERVRSEIDAIIEECDTRPIEKTVRSALRGSRQLLRQASRRIGRVMRSLRRDDPDETHLHLEDSDLEQELDQGNEDFERLVDRMAREIEAESGYFEALAARLTLRLQEAPTPPPSSPEPPLSPPEEPSPSEEPSSSSEPSVEEPGSETPI